MITVCNDQQTDKNQARRENQWGACFIWDKWKKLALCPLPPSGSRQLERLQDLEQEPAMPLGTLLYTVSFALSIDVLTLALPISKASRHATGRV